MAELSPSILIITLSVNCLNTKLKGKDWQGCLNKQTNMTRVCCIQETHFKYNNISSLKIKRWKKIEYGNIDLKKNKSNYVNVT